MLRKLLKYDLRANLKVYLIIWPAILALGLIESLLIRAELRGYDIDTLGILVTFLFTLSIFGAFIFSLIIAVTRFYKGLLGEEGYLMFTLPVRPWQLILSKLLTALLTIVVTAAVSFLACIFMFNSFDIFGTLVESVFSQFDLPTGTSLVLISLIALFGIARQLLQIYMACAIGHLANRHRVLWSVLAYYGINILLNTISYSGLLEIDSSVSFNGYLAIELAGQLVLCTAFYLVAERILSKRLNLE